jgi:hypothetical protein
MSTIEIPQKDIDTLRDETTPALLNGSHDAIVTDPIPSDQYTKFAGPALRAVGGETLPDLTNAPNTAVQKEGLPVMGPQEIPHSPNSAFVLDHPAPPTQPGQ